MADEQPVHDVSEDESKKDTVQINLPQGGAPKTTAAMPTPTVRLKPSGAPGVAPSAASKKDTAAISPPSASSSSKDTSAITPPAAVPKPRKDVAHVPAPAAKPTVPEMPRPTVKLKREEPVPVAAPTAAPVTAASATPVAVDSATSMIDVGLALAAMVVALAAAGYLFSLSRS